MSMTSETNSTLTASNFAPSTLCLRSITRHASTIPFVQVIAVSRARERAQRRVRANERSVL